MICSSPLLRARRRAPYLLSGKTDSDARLTPPRDFDMREATASGRKWLGEEERGGKCGSQTLIEASRRLEGVQDR
jgi:hypothetical protein